MSAIDTGLIFRTITIKRSFQIAVLFLFIGINAGAQEAPSASVVREIQTGDGPEDIVHDHYEGRNRILISSSNRTAEEKEEGGIYSLNIHTGYDYKLPISNRPADFFFGPHGISIVQQSDGATYLYAISHAPGAKKPKHQIVKFRVRKDALELVEIFEHDLLISPNDLTALPDGTFYFTNDSKRSSMNFGYMLEKIFRVRSSTVIYKDEKDEFRVAAKRLAYANGICQRNDSLWVSTTQKKDLRLYLIQKDGGLEKAVDIAKIKGMDNLHLQGPWLYTTAHPSFSKFIKHAGNQILYNSPSEVYRIHTKTKEKQLIFKDDGSEISAASVALPIGNKVFVGQVFEDYLLEISIK